MRHFLVFCLAALAFTLAEPARAAEPADDHAGHDHAGHDHAGAAEHGDHGAAHGDHGAAHGEHGGEHVPSFAEINWYHGMLGAKDGVEPSLLFRPTGTPVPLAALLLNTAILYYLLYRLFGNAVTSGLKRRKETILRGMDEASRMKREAEQQLAGYEAKLAHVDEELTRLQRETREAGEAERVRILAEAKERRVRMERDARILIEQELKGVRERLIQETVATALRSAQEELVKRLTEADQQRFAEDYLAEIQKAGPLLRGRL